MTTSVTPPGRPASPRPGPGAIDAHVHLWDPSVLTYDWLAGTPLDRRYDGADLAAAGGVDRIVVVQADCRPDQSLAEVRWITGLPPAGPTVAGIVAHAPLESGRAVRSHLVALRDEPLVVGVRRLLQDEPAGFTGTVGFRDGLGELAATGLPFDLCIRAHQLTEIRTLVADFPDVGFVLDHFGKPPVGGPFGPWRDDLSALAALPNVACKLSGLATEVVEGELSAAAVQPYLQHVLKTFGPDRCLFGSDWPVMTLGTTYSWWLDVVCDALDDLQTEQRDAVLRTNAERIYHLPTPTPGSDR